MNIDHENETGIDAAFYPAQNYDAQQLKTLINLKHAGYMVPCRMGNQNECSHMEFAAYLTPNGEKFIPVFTVPGELDKWPYGHDKAALLSFDDLKYTVLNEQYNLSGIIIDPFSKKIFLRQKQIEQIDLMADDAVIHNVKHSKEAKISKLPSEMPQLAQALKAFFCSRENIYKAYILMMQEPGDFQSHILVVVDFDGQVTELFPELSKVICENLNQGETFEMMKASYNLLTLSSSLSRPIYQKD